MALPFAIPRSPRVFQSAFSVRWWIPGCNARRALKGHNRACMNFEDSRCGFPLVQRVPLCGMRYQRACAVGLFAVSFSVAQEPSGSLAPEEAWRYIGKNEIVCGQVVDASYVKSAQDSTTYLFLERPSPEQVFTVVIPIEKRDLFGENPEKMLKGKRVCITGKIESDRSKGSVDPRHRAVIVI